MGQSDGTGPQEREVFRAAERSSSLRESGRVRQRQLKKIRTPGEGAIGNLDSSYLTATTKS